MTQQEAVWIVDVWDIEYSKFALTRNTINQWYEAERILSGRDKISPRSCSCEWRVVARQVHALRNQHDVEIQKLYNESKTTTPKRGRKKQGV